MNTAIAAYSSTEAALNDLATKYKGVVYDVTKAEGMALAKAAYKDINSHSITLEKAREKEKAESLAYGRHVDAEAKRIAERLDALRLPIKGMIETETKRVEREREAAVQAEKDRIAAEEKASKDAEEARMAAERAEIARGQEELRKAQQEAARQVDEAQRASRLKIEEEERKARQQRDEADREAKKIRDAEEARLKDERERIAEAQRLIEQAERKERERREAEQREIQRREAELLDARQMLESFCTRFGPLQQYESIVGIIEAFLQKKAA